MLLGAGRGGLIPSILDAIESQEAVFFIVEKNLNCKNAINSRLRRYSQLKESKKKFIQERTVILFKNSSELEEEDFIFRGHSLLPRIVVSEMLGSFGCNELSPEILYTLDR